MVILIRPGWGEEEEGCTPACCLSLDRSLINNRRQGETAAAAAAPTTTTSTTSTSSSSSSSSSYHQSCEEQRAHSEDSFLARNRAFPRVSECTCPAERRQLELFMGKLCTRSQLCDSDAKAVAGVFFFSFFFFKFDRLGIKLQASGRGCMLT